MIRLKRELCEEVCAFQQQSFGAETLPNLLWMQPWCTTASDDGNAAGHTPSADAIVPLRLSSCLREPKRDGALPHRGQLRRLSHQLHLLWLRLQVLQPLLDDAAPPHLVYVVETMVIFKDIVHVNNEQWWRALTLATSGSG
uniref:Uncharacterized protein n=1 Tax=Oryza brachyantha TaxID=4533 RepID=J3M7C6_ORYBR